FAMAVKSGRSGRQAGLMAESDSAVATSPLTSFLTSEEKK
ncbi:unnamed protein product, partial [marine sediment metagenome]